MFPFPQFITGNLTLKLKLISSELGVAIIRFYGMSAYREGNVIDVGFTKLQVVDACSGLRYFLPLIVLGILLAYYFSAALWKRILLVLIRNSLVDFYQQPTDCFGGYPLPILGAGGSRGFFSRFFRLVHLYGKFGNASCCDVVFESHFSGNCVGCC